MKASALTNVAWLYDDVIAEWQVLAAAMSCEQTYTVEEIISKRLPRKKYVIQFDLTFMLRFMFESTTFFSRSLQINVSRLLFFQCGRSFFSSSRLPRRGLRAAHRLAN